MTKPTWLHRYGYWPVTLAIVLGTLIGASISWAINYRPPPWLEFEQVRVTNWGDGLLSVLASYEVNRPCPRQRPPLWRTEVIRDDGRIMQYGPDPDSQSMRRLAADGRGMLYETVVLNAGTDPQGWGVSILVICPEFGAVVSPLIVVEAALGVP